MITIKNVTKRYGEKVVLKNINLEFSDNKIYGISGINGSGKTLILKAVAGYIKPSSGWVFQGENAIRSKGNYIRNAGILIENPKFLSQLSLIENLISLKRCAKIHHKLIWKNGFHITI